MKYTAPDLALTAFNCPHCAAFAAQKWHFTCSVSSDNGYSPPGLKAVIQSDSEVISTSDVGQNISKGGRTKFTQAFGDPLIIEDIYRLYVSECFNCKMLTLWIGDRIIFPNNSNAPSPNSDTPDHIVTDYREAATIVAASPRGAAALLRLAIQKLCKHLGQPGKNINQDIKSLVENGLPSSIQKALDIVRVTGNESVHPGEMNIQDNSAVAHNLFGIFNFIVEKMISEPKKVDEIYTALPPEKLAQIEARDKKSKS